MAQEKKEQLLTVIRDAHAELTSIGLDEWKEFQVLMLANFDMYLADLSARIPYGTKIRTGENFLLGHQTPIICTLDEDMIKDIRINHSGVNMPYLFPMESMTDEQKIRCNALQDMGPDYYHLLIDRYNEWHLDYRGLITKGLALDATGLNIY